MPITSTIIAGISAAAGIGANRQAKKAAGQQASAQRQQDTTAKERAALAAQGRSTDRADVVLGATPTVSPRAAAKKKKLAGTPSAGTKVGGLMDGGSNIGGL
jgi:hypothetical protein